MVTLEERRALLAVTCPHCGAAPEEDCYVPGSGKPGDIKTRRWAPRRITTLEGGAHDARWRKALGRPATVLTGAIPHPDPVRPSDRRTAPPTGSVAVVARPW